jgi:hypothetical protein
MAKSKKGALHQLLVVMVDATDFASVESGITESDFNSGVTKKFYGVNTGGSAATTSGTISKTASLVRSGVFRVTIKGTENNYDKMMARFSKTGTAEQIYEWDNVDNDDSDLMSALTVIQSMASDAASAAVQTNSRVLLNQSRISDIASFLVVMSGIQSDVYSLLSDLESNFGSRVPKRVATDSQLSDVHSDLASKIAGITASVSASDISDIASAVWANTIGARVDSRVLLNQSRISDAYSMLSDLLSDFQSRVPKRVATDSQLSDVHSDLKSAIAGITASVSASDISDIASAVWANAIGTRVDSRVLLNLSRISDAYSLLSDLESNFGSRVPKEVASKSLLSDVNSDLASKIGGITASVSASDISDIASAVKATLASDLSDILSAATQTNSRVLVNQSRVSDIYSLVSDLHSDFQSRVTGVVPTGSDVASKVWAEKYTAASNVKASTFGSVVRLNMSRVSDIYSLLSDLHSDVGVISGVVSDIDSLIEAGVPLDASTMSDLRSAITATELDASDLSDIASAVWAQTRTEPTTVVSPTGTMKTGMEWLVALSRNKITQTATVQSLRDDADSADIASAAVSDDGTTFVRGEFGN